MNTTSAIIGMQCSVMLVWLLGNDRRTISPKVNLQTRVIASGITSNMSY